MLDNPMVCCDVARIEGSDDGSVTIVGRFRLSALVRDSSSLRALEKILES